jgi:hypothetical protein
MSSCTDFEEEETMLQSIGASLNAPINGSLKCHHEILGEGFE